MKRKYFLRRAAIFFGLMLIPTLVLFMLFLGTATLNAEDSMIEKGRQTLQAAVNNCEVMIDRTTQQNDLLTSTTRMNVSLKRALNETEMTYGDSVFMTALGSLIRTTVDANPPLDNVLIWLDGAPRLFSSDGSSNLKYVEQQKDLAWMDAYQQMDAEQRDKLFLTTNSEGVQQVVSIRRLLLQKGCTVVHIDASTWMEELKTLLQRDNEHLIVTTREGELLLYVSNDQNGSWQLDEALLKTFLSMPEEQWQKHGKERFMVSRQDMDHLQVMTVISYDAVVDTLKVVQQTFLAILLVNICVVMLLAYVTTKRTCNQMMLMIDMLDNAVKGLPVERPKRRSRDEYDVIMNNILYMYLRDASLQSELQQKQYQQEHAEMMALQLQINPHFLYNTLQTLDVTIRGGKVDRFDLCDIIRSVSDILKYALSDPQQSVTLRDEIHYLKEYASVQKFRFGNQFVLYYEVDDDLLDCQVFRLMLQPLVENSMLHGLNGLSERGYIWVRARREGELLHISVKDSGHGMTPESMEKLRQGINNPNSRSIGLTNLNRRLLLRYGESSALQITAAQGEGMEVAFTIPFEQAKVEEKVSFLAENDKQ